MSFLDGTLCPLEKTIKAPYNKKIKHVAKIHLQKNSTAGHIRGYILSY